MKQLLAAVFFSSMACAAWAQADTTRIFLNGDFSFASKKDFLYTGLEFPAGDHWQLYAVYPDTSVLMKVLYKDRAMRIKDGPFFLYFSKRKLAKEGRYVNNIPEGHWVTYYPSGEKHGEGEVKHNQLIGEWRSWYQNGQLESVRTYVYVDSITTGDPVHENSPVNIHKALDEPLFEATLRGPAQLWYANGQKQYEVNYLNDSLDGTCSFFRPNGQPSSVEVYNNGKLEDVKCYDENGQYTGATCSISKLPVFIHPFFDAVDYIEDKLHSEKHPSIAEGNVTVSFTVTTEGKVKDLRVPYSPDPRLSKLVTKIINEMPAWSPAVIHNRKIDYPVQLNIPYYN